MAVVDTDEGMATHRITISDTVDGIEILRTNTISTEDATAYAINSEPVISQANELGHKQSGVRSLSRRENRGRRIVHLLRPPAFSIPTP